MIALAILIGALYLGGFVLFFIRMRSVAGKLDAGLHGNENRDRTDFQHNAAEGIWVGKGHGDKILRQAAPGRREWEPATVSPVVRQMTSMHAGYIFASPVFIQSPQETD